MKLAAELKSPEKVLINIKNNNQKCFLWCHVRHINPVKIYLERIKWADKKLANDLNYDRVGFPVQEKDFSSIKTKNNICINVFCYENKLVFPIYISDQKFENSMDLLLATEGDKLHRLYIKDFDRFMFHKKKKKNKKYFRKSCRQGFSSINVSKKHKENCLSIIGAQSVRLEKEKIDFKNYFKQIPVPIKIYADFECNLKKVESYHGFYSKNIKITFLIVWLTNLFLLMMNLLSQ